jgi:hypothetical protein
LKLMHTYPQASQHWPSKLIEALVVVVVVVVVVVDAPCTPRKPQTASIDRSIDCTASMRVAEHGTEISAICFEYLEQLVCDRSLDHCRYDYAHCACDSRA